MGAIVFGRERDQPGVLIELKPPFQIDVEDESAVIEIRNVIWSVTKYLSATGVVTDLDF